MAIGSLALRVGANTKPFNQAMSRTKGPAKSLSAQLTDVGRKSTKMAAAMTTAGVAISAALIKNSIEGAKETANLAKVAGTTAGEFTRLSFAAKSVGVQQDKFSDILKDTNDRIGDFLSTGGGPMADFFEKIAPKVGVTADQFRNLSGPQGLQLYVDSLEKANLSQAEMTFFMEALSSDATKLLPLLRDGGAAMQEQASQADKLGIALSSIEIRQMEQAGVAMEQTGAVFEGFVDKISAELSPVIEGLSKEFMGAAEDAGGIGSVVESTVDNGVAAFAFLADAIDSVRRVFVVAGQAIATGALAIQRDMIGAAEIIMSGPVDAINALIRAANLIPGVEFPEVEQPDIVTGLREQIAAADAAVQEGKAAMNRTLMEPLPGEGIRQWVTDTKDAADDAAKAALEGRAKIQAALGNDGPSSNEEAEAKKEKEAAMKRMQSRLAVFRFGLKTEREQEIQRNTEKQALLRQSLENELLTKKEFNALEAEQTAAHQKKVKEIENRASEERQKQAAEEADRKLGAFSSAFGDLSTLMNSESKKQFEIGKKAALAQAGIDAYRAITGAYAVGSGIGGPPLGAAFAAAAGVAQAANVQAIQSQSFGSGGGGASATQQVSNQSAPIQGAGQQQGGQRQGGNTVINLTGDSFGRGQVRELLEQINEERGDGSVMVRG